MPNSKHFKSLFLKIASLLVFVSFNCQLAGPRIIIILIGSNSQSACIQCQIFSSHQCFRKTDMYVAWNLLSHFNKFISPLSSNVFGIFAMPGPGVSKRQQKREKAAEQKMAAEKKTGLKLDFTCTKLPNRVYVEPDKQHPAQMIEAWLSHKQDAVSLFYGHLDIRAGDCIALQPDPNCSKSISASLGQVTSFHF